jgi:hypothetical protein
MEEQAENTANVVPEKLMDDVEDINKHFTIT